MNRPGGPLLFTPGPLTTSPGVKEAMLVDVGSRDATFIRVVREIRQRLVALAQATEPDWTAIPMQGSGTFTVEALLSSVVPERGRLLVISNGAYGRRMAQIARVAGIPHVEVAIPEVESITPHAVVDALSRHWTTTHVAMVHSETTTGLVNPVEAIGPLVQQAGVSFLVDAMSSFGGIPLDVPGAGIDFLVSSANKCIEGVPGFGFVIARRAALAASVGSARSLSLDLHAQLDGLERAGQFRFTPPTHALLAFHRALDELAAEGGVEGRARRYRDNATVLANGMEELGFEPLLPRDGRGYIITSYRYPTHAAWRFEELYSRLAERGFVIYPGKVSDADCFRIGTIGRLFPRDVAALLVAISHVLRDMGIPSLKP